MALCQVFEFTRYKEGIQKPAFCPNFGLVLQSFCIENLKTGLNCLVLPDHDVEKMHLKTRLELVLFSKESRF